MRFLRRRLGVTQRELAYVLGYDSDSQVSRIENGSRMPLLEEVLIIELVFGVPGMTIFPQVRNVVGKSVCNRVRTLIRDSRQSDDGHPRLSYKTAQLERVLASLGSRDELDQSVKSV